MTLTKTYALELMAEAVNLPHGNYVLALSVETVMEKCNGVGAEWMEHVKLWGLNKTLLQFANEVYSWALPATVRHDVRYAVGGTEEMRKNDDKCFLEDCLYIADRLYAGEHWYNPMRYVRYIHRKGQARRMYVLLRAFGHRAYNFDNAADAEESAWLESELAKEAEAEYIEKLPAEETK